MRRTSSAGRACVLWQDQPGGAKRESRHHRRVIRRVHAFKARGEEIGIGRFADRGNMGIFRTRERAEEFAKQDPLILEGFVKSFVIRDWNDTMLT